MENRFQINLRGIIELLGSHLYSDSSVFVRELIQNAVDAIAARREVEPGHDGRVSIELIAGGEGPATILVRDNGIGLTQQEMHEFLATIGSSSKREESELEGQRSSFIGQFGIGILSCFMVSDEIVVVSRSARAGDHSAVEWRGKADGSYAVRTLSGDHRPGTQVYVRVRANDEDAAVFFTADRLVELARRFGEMLRTPIEVTAGDRLEPITRPGTPWEMMAAGDLDGLKEYAIESLGFEPLDVVALSASAGDVRGVAFIQPSPVAATNWSEHTAYLRGMFVTEHAYALLPKWAFFTRCVVNANALRPTASRESFQDDGVLEQARTQLGACLRRHLVQLIRSDPTRLTVLMSIHDVAIRSLALDDDEFFDVVIDLLEFETTVGRVRFGEFRRENEVIRVARTGEQFRRIAPIATAHGTCVFNAGFVFHEELLRRASERLPGLVMQAVDSSDLIGELLPIEDEHAELASGLLSVATEELAAFEVTPVLRRFRPESLPAFYGLGSDAEFHRSIDRSKAVARGHWQQILEAMKPADEPVARTYLCFNWTNPLVRSLAACPNADLQRTVTRVLYVQSLMMGQHPLSSRETRLLTESMSEILGICLDAKERP